MIQPLLTQKEGSLQYIAHNQEVIPLTLERWTQWHIPCKHSLTCIQIGAGTSYQKLSMDAEAIQKEFSSKLVDQQQQESVSPALQQGKSVCSMNY